MSESLILRTTASVTEVERRLAERLVLPGGALDAMSDPKPEKPEGIRFSGTVSDGRFDLTRWVPYANSFRPRLRGRLIPSDGGTVVECRVDSSGVWARVAVGLLVACFVAWFPLAEFGFALRREVLIPLGVVGGVVLAFVIGTKIERAKAKRGLAFVVGADHEDG